MFMKVKRYFRVAWEFIKRRKILSSAILVAAVLALAVSRLSGGALPETISFSSEDLVRTVRVAGKVVPREKVDLSFEVSGTVSSAPKDVGASVYRGETLVRLDAGGIAAQIEKAQADLSSAEAELAKLEGEEVYENSIANAKRSLNQAMRDAYAAAADAVYNKADQVFVDPTISYPKIAGNFKGLNDLRDRVESERPRLSQVLSDWQKLVSELKLDSYSSELTQSKSYLARIYAYINDLSRIVSAFEATSYMTQASIDSYKADMRSAQTALNQASQDFIDSEKSLTQVLSDVPVQVAKVEAARAYIQNLRFQASRYSITSPISGILSRQEAKLGQAVSANSVLVSVITADNIIETFVPEVTIADVRTGNSAKVTLDAYGSSIEFPVRVIHVDPAETVKDGVSTYKVKLAFDRADERIRSGMTANVEIETLRRAGTMIIPERTLMRQNGETFVYVLEGKSSKKVPVTVGERDSRGNVEILSGLTLADKVLVTPPTK